jgi:hypothetical protein
MDISRDAVHIDLYLAHPSKLIMLLLFIYYGRNVSDMHRFREVLSVSHVTVGYLLEGIILNLYRFDTGNLYRHFISLL